jgi:hypothetical protein
MLPWLLPSPLLTVARSGADWQTLSTQATRDWHSDPVTLSPLLPLILSPSTKLRINSGGQRRSQRGASQISSNPSCADRNLRCLPFDVLRANVGGGEIVKDLSSVSAPELSEPVGDAHPMREGRSGVSGHPLLHFCLFIYNKIIIYEPYSFFIYRLSRTPPETSEGVQEEAPS